MRSKWLVLALLCCAYFFYLSGRMLFGLLVLPIQQDTGLTDLQIGLADSVLFWTIALLAPVSGFLGDRFSRTRIIAVAVLLWGAFTMLTGLVGGLIGFIVVRAVLTTAAQIFYVPSATALIASEHRSTRTTALAVHEGAMYFGMLASGALVAMLLKLTGSWRSVYCAYGVMIMLVGLVMALALWNHDEQPAVARKGLLSAGMKAFFGNPAALCIGSGFVAVLFVSNGFAVWAPKFVALKFNLTVGAAARAVMFWPNVLAMVAAVGGGVVTDWLVRKYPRVRLVIYISVFLSAVPVLAVIGFAPRFLFAWGGLVAWGLLRGLYVANSKATLFDFVQPEFRASAVGFLNIVTALVGSLAPLTVGWASHRYGLRGLEVAFSAMGGVLAAAAALVMYAYWRLFDKYKVKE